MPDLRKIQDYGNPNEFGFGCWLFTKKYEKKEAWNNFENLKF